MSAPSDPHAEVRRELIEAIEAGKWEFTRRALREGLLVFNRHSENPSDAELIDYILGLLELGFPLRKGNCTTRLTGMATKWKTPTGRGSTSS
jgi:hypothetical protein